MVKIKRHNYIVSPYKHIIVSGQKRASVGFKTKAGAISFIKRRGLKHAILLVKRKRRR